VPITGGYSGPYEGPLSTLIIKDTACKCGSGGGGGGNIIIADLGPEDFLDPLTWNIKGFAFPLAPDTTSYYAKVIYNKIPIFSPDGGTTKYSYLGYYGKSSGVPTKSSCAFSNDGITWTNRQNVTGPGAVNTGYHFEVILVGTQILLWYWNGVTMGYVPTDMHFATANVNNCQTFLTDASCLNGLAPWIFGGGGSPNGGTYGPCQAFHNPTPTNIPSDPWSYRYTMYVNTTDGSKEFVFLITSDDGITWDLSAGPIIPLGAGGAWDNNDATYLVTWLDAFGEWHGFYSGGQSTPQEGLGYVTSSDGINWTKHPSNPIFKFGAGNWTARCYTPSILKKRGVGTTMLLYWTGDNGAGIRRTYIANPLPYTRLSINAYEPFNQGVYPNAP